MKKQSVRCAIYTRKSVEDGLGQEFNSLDAQRSMCESYIQCRKEDGWAVLPTHYDDGGYSGGNMKRPALQALLSDIKSGKIDAVVVYKIDRLSRSLLDFVKLNEQWKRYQVDFVSVTQDINTASFVGRMLLNLLMTFAQYEMEMTSERIRDKIAECSRQRKFCAAFRRWATKKIRIRINLSLFPCTRFRTRRKSPFCSYFSRFFNGKIMKIKKRYSEPKTQKIASC